jgi:hypothetical protein
MLSVIQEGLGQHYSSGLIMMKHDEYGFFVIPFMLISLRTSDK